MSGPGAKPLLARVFLPHSAHFTNFRPWTMHRGALLDSRDEPLDDVLAVFMPGPRTYTGEDVAEIHCHGGPAIVHAALDSLLRLGARLAEPGEFTRRAYLNGRMDLTQAEAVAELIAAPGREAARHSFGRLEGRLAAAVESLAGEVDELRALARLGVDFPEEEVEALPRDAFQSRVGQIMASIRNLLKNTARANMMANGARVALAGAVNAGKSSLFNALCGHSRALVTDIPGTTRDYLDYQLSLDGLPVVLIDTAGLHGAAADRVELLGIEQSHAIMEDADLVCLVLDGLAASGSLDAGVRDIVARCSSRKGLVVWNKCDLAPLPPVLPQGLPEWPVCAVSALTGENVDHLADMIRELLLGGMSEGLPDDCPPPNARQTRVLASAMEELSALVADIAADAPYDCCFTRLDAAALLLGQVLSLAPDDVILDKIFSRFCIGK